MAIDARFDKITKIERHPNADTLDIATVSNFPCIVKRGEFNEGDWCFYIRDDAKLIGYDELKRREERDREAARTGAFVTQDCFTCTFQWQDPLLKYLGNGGRVKTIKLRGRTSMGILLKPSEVWPVWMGDFGDHIKDENIQWFNDRFNAEDGADYLENNFGIKHWTAPQTNIGDLNILHTGLEDDVKVSDENNWENLSEEDLHLGCKCLVTKKLDGTSCTVICRADDTYSVATRHNTLRPECDNVYTKYTKEAVKAGLWYAKKYNVTVVFQGEICTQSVQRMDINKDKELNDFFVYKCYFPNNENWHEKMGTYGTASHFTNIVDICNKEGGFNLKTVPVLGEEVITRELLRKYNDMPAEWGEGVVINVKVEDGMDTTSVTWDYKSKSREYLLKSE